MQELELRSNDGSKTARLKMAEPDDLPTVLAIAFVKSGSVMLDIILQSLCAASGRSYVQPDSNVFAQGLVLEEFEQALEPLFTPQGFVFGVFRTYLSTFQRLDTFKKIVLIRDPRDAAVSYYFSIRNSHTLPKTGKAREALLAGRSAFQNSDLNEMVKNGSLHFLFHRMQQLGSLITLPNTVVYRYEDIVFNKAAWIKSLADDLEIEVPEARQKRILEKVDIFPASENPDNHIRNVVPGDYKEKMRPDTIGYIEEKYKPLLDFLGYT
jgi:hypothetical protein